MSFAGTVESVGPDVTGFSPGDRVATVRDGPKAADPRFGAYQQYALASVTSTAKIPESVTLEDSATTILNLAAIAAAFSIHMGLDRPSLTASAPTKNGKKILIYGGSSPAGGLATSYAVAAGYEVITTTSPRNKDYVASLNPSGIIDHSQPAKDIVSQLHSAGPYTAVFDAIGLPAVTEILSSYFTSIGGGTYYSLLGPDPDKPLPEGVVRKFAPYSLAMDQPQHSEFRTWFYGELVPKGLASGVIVPTRAQWITGGLGKAQHALDLMMEGIVSGRKLLMDPSA